MDDHGAAAALWSFRRSWSRWSGQQEGKESWTWEAAKPASWDSHLLPPVNWPGATRLIFHGLSFSYWLKKKKKHLTVWSLSFVPRPKGHNFVWKEAWMHRWGINTSEGKEVRCSLSVGMVWWGSRLPFWNHVFLLDRNYLIILSYVFMMSVNNS